jgi:biopolymer transport protein TolR
MAMDSGQSSGKPGRATPSMNVTPLVDVVLVLLIIFMVVTPLLAKQFWINLPNQVDKQEPPASDDDTALVVRVTKSGQITVNTEVVSAAELTPRLRRMLSARKDRTIFFDADEEADFGKAVTVMDLARGGGATTIAVVTAPLKLKLELQP